MLWFVIACELGLCTDRRPPPTDEPYVLDDDGGGQLVSAEADRADLEAWGGRVEITGFCRSACVIFTTLPNACVAPDAVLGFHGSNINQGPIGNQQMARYLRGEAKRRYEDDWQNIPPTDIHRIDARDYVKLDPEVRICGE
ncbi:hypothetical protein SAMN04488003_101489 [Loktanella fryxellensis]|uniref:Uncharacterized protein n=1 Tax=Loktanella fryxellensis TaxID=245187 RepID=A0A1H7Z9M9_9RHOB|nr:hypothetical protein [Loktanella fryxellensis]SEM54704.1 hypothetical protein SAMN04488003_101489 [Loktanella fryxellensis]